ncbi:MAG: hypothetical protein JWN66_1823 [Sphingomonas bacterium]|nr:hypothetical protein [Sphingomonas bacterium]
MNPDLTGVLVITVIGATLLVLAAICGIGRTPPPQQPRTDRSTRTPPPDITLGFRDPYR